MEQNALRSRQSARADAGPFRRIRRFFQQSVVGMYYDIGNHWKYGQPRAWLNAFGRRAVKLDVKGFSRAKNKFVDITSDEDDLPWMKCVRARRHSVYGLGDC